MAGVYTNLYNAGNRSGVHTFNGTLLINGLSAGAGNATIQPHQNNKEGELVSIRRQGAVILEFIELHRNGRQGGRNLDQDTFVIEIFKLAALSEADQTIIAASEQLPGRIGRPIT